MVGPGPRAVACAVALALGGRSLAAQQTEVLRGRVVTTDSLPIEHATVIATATAGTMRSTTTDRDGRFVLTFPSGSGEYAVSFQAIGFAPLRMGVQRAPGQTVMVVNAVLVRRTVRLDPTAVRARRSRIGRGDRLPDVGGTERFVDPLVLAPEQQGDLAAMAGSLAGVLLVPGADGDPSGLSVLGLSPDQNMLMLNGMDFMGGLIPRSAALSVSLATSPYDVSRGGFSGGQLDVRPAHGSDLIARSVDAQLDAPALQWTGGPGRAFAREFTRRSSSGMASGPLRPGRAFYNLAYQIDRTSARFGSLLGGDPAALQTAGIASDSAARLLDILGALGVPAATGTIRSTRIRDRAALIASFNLAPPTAISGRALDLTLSGDWSRASPAAPFVTELPAHGADLTSWHLAVQGGHSAYVGPVLSETRLAISAASSHGDPYLALPNGAVRIASTFAGGSGAIRTAAFGGNATVGVSQSGTILGVRNVLMWLSANGRHRFRLSSEARRLTSAETPASSALGTFEFNSLADLEAGRPASFTRQIAPDRRASALAGAVSFGDLYRVNDNLSIQIGGRADGIRFGVRPARNPDLEAAFGISNTVAPSRVSASPRFGVAWGYGQTSPFGSTAEQRPGGPAGVIRGGVGMFQQVPGPTLVHRALGATGLPGAAAQVACVGASVPVPDWGAYLADPASIPWDCAGEASGASLSNTAPDVVLFDRRYAAPRSIRSNLQWSTLLAGGRLAATFDATYSSTRRLPDPIDLNFAGVKRFVLADEGNRPVFARERDIVPQTGVLSNGAARVSPRFARVRSLRSDLRSEARQLSIQLRPARRSGRTSWSLSYVRLAAREQTSGFASTAGTPLGSAWSRSSFDARHQIVATVSRSISDLLRVDWYSALRSGTPYTPTVASDVNGDGYANDRAFLFDPEQAADPAVAAGMRALLDDAPASVRRCLRRSLGRVAARNSCEGPWTSTSTVRISVNPAKLHLPARTSVSLIVSNPVGAADLLLHGSGGVHGWGQAAVPDPVLLYVRGFDPQARRYQYEVNPRFGVSRPSVVGVRAPVALTLAVRLDVGPSRERQALLAQLDRGRRVEGSRLQASLLERMYGSSGLPNPMTQLLRQSDSIGLRGWEADSVAAINRWYLSRADSIWAPVARRLAGAPADYDRDEAFAAYARARVATLDLLLQAVPWIRGLLTADQRERLPPSLRAILNEKGLSSLRPDRASWPAWGRP